MKSEAKADRLDFEEASQLSPRELREAIRLGRWLEPTQGLAPGYLQTNLVIVPLSAAFEFLRFCFRNPKPCPVIEISDPGSPEFVNLAPGADIRTDLPRYRIFIDGQLADEPTEILEHWRDDAVAFLLGCSVTFEAALLRAGIPMRHLENGSRTSSYVTNIACTPSGRFSGPLVASMRPIPAQLVSKTVELTARFPQTHGTPIHIGRPEALGIRDLNEIAWGDPPSIEDGDVPVFWAGGSTPQLAAKQARLPYMVTHSPGHMFITDASAE